MGGAWELLTRVCHVLNLSLSPLWLFLLLCPSDNPWRGCLMKEESAIHQADSPVLALAKPQSRSLTYVQGSFQEWLSRLWGLV